MGKKKQEMSQVYHSSNNEFIFGEKGGKGKHLSSFLKNLSLTSSSKSGHESDNYKEVNRSIYGNLSYGSPKPNSSGSIVSKDRSPMRRTVSVGASFSHMGSTPSPERSSSLIRPTPLMHSSQSKIASSGMLKNGRRSHSITRYADLDDDWDADLNEVATATDKNSPPTASEAESTIKLQPSLMMDLLYPDLTIPASIDHENTDPSVVKKESLDEADIQASFELSKLNQLNSKFMKFRAILTGDSSINIQELRKLSWNGIPSELRAVSWQLLLGYLPTNRSRQISTLKMKRQGYLEGIEATSIDFSEDKSSNTPASNLANSREKQLYHQINIDVKRTNPTIKLYSYPTVQQSIRRVLYLWAVRHPASGYVQGINDLSTPFFQIFLGNYLWQLQNRNSNEDLFIPGILDENDQQEQELLADPKLMTYNSDNIDPSRISSRVMSIIEADTYWCLSKLLDTITDNYIHQQPGIIRQVNELRNLISKIDIDLIRHFDNEGIEFIQFAFRWMNCLLMRELAMPFIIRMWDTYFSETPLGAYNFHIYVCAAFLIKFSPELKELDFQGILLFLQNPPTSTWNEKDVQLILSEAFIWQSLYKNAGAHLR